MKKNSSKTFLSKSLALLLVALMLVPSLASCGGSSEIQDTEIPVYTFYGIKGEGTTDDAIRNVELAINRILISRYTFAVDFRLFPENEYEQALDDAFKAVDEYKPSSNEKSDIYTEDKIIDMLSSGQDFKFEEPRVDVLICKDYAHYVKLIAENRLSGLDTLLENEGKVLTEYIHPNLLSLAKLGRKTYGIPNNVAMGEYEYIVFDKQYLTEHKYDYTTMKTMEDLEDYLKVIKENHENVIPLQKAGSPKMSSAHRAANDLKSEDPQDYEFLFDENHSFFLEPKKTNDEITINVFGTYDTEKESYLIDEYATLLAKYRSAGYLAESGTSGDFAVTFMKGTPADIEALEKETGKEYEYVVYKNPVGTKKSLEALYSISSSVDPTVVTSVIDIIVALFTDSQIKDYFYHGIQGENYIINDNGLIEPIKNELTGKFEYVMDDKYTGNIYLPTLRQGENPEIKEHIKEINLAASISLTSGFEYTPKKYKGGTLEEPNYVNIIGEIYKESYSKFIDGSFGIIDFEEFKVEYAEKFRTETMELFASQFSEAIIEQHFEGYFETQEFLDEVALRAEFLVLDGLRRNAKVALEMKFKEEILKKNPNATAEEIAAELETLITDDEIDNFIETTYDDAYLEKQINDRKNIVFDELKAPKVEEYQNSEEYKSKYEAYISSEQYNTEVETYINENGEDYIYSKYIEAITKKIKEEVDVIHKQAMAAVDAKIKEFNSNWEDPKAESDIDVFNYLDFITLRLEAQYYEIYTPAT